MTSYTAPMTYVAGNALTAAQQNTYVRDNIKNLKERLDLIATTVVGVLVHRTNTQSIANDSDVAVRFGTGDVGTDVDTDSFQDPSSFNGTRLIVPSGLDGWYDVRGVVTFASGGTGYRNVWLELNGAVIWKQASTPTAGIQWSVSINAMVEMAATDYVTLNVHHTQGGALDIGASPTYFGMFLRYTA